MSIVTQCKIKLMQLYQEKQFRKALKSVSSLSPQQAKEQLEHRHANSYPVFEQDNEIDKRYDVMIIIPVYNAQAYLGECLDSIFAQETQYTMSVVIVNDGSTDGSRDIIKQYEARPGVTVIDQANSGVSAARNHALRHINASYVMFVDADDYLPTDAVEVLLKTAYEKDADIVQGAYTRFGCEETGGTFDLLSGITEIPLDHLSGYACMKVIRAERLQQFCFPLDYRYEDAVTELLLYPQCHVVYSVPHVVYYYRSHEQAFCADMNNPHLYDTYWIMRYGLEEHVKRGYPLGVTEYVHYLRLCRTNWIRLPADIQESVFVMTAEQFVRIFGEQTLPRTRYTMLHRALKACSFKAFKYVMENWDNI